MKKLLAIMMLMPMVALADKETVNGRMDLCSYGKGRAASSKRADNSASEFGETTTNGVKWTYKVVNGAVVLGKGLRRRLHGGEIAAVPKDTAGALIIPESLGGMPVRSIGIGAFDGCKGLTSVTIPMGVTNIEREAFLGCSGLTAVTIPEGVIVIGSRAFTGCSRLTSLMIPSSVTRIGNLDCGGLMSFSVDSKNPRYSVKSGLLCSKDGTTLVGGVNGEVSVPLGVTRIGAGAFSCCERLTSVSIPLSVTNIGRAAFQRCNGLKRVTIPSSVTSMDDNAFIGCGGLMSFSVDSGNPVYSARSGFLCSKDGSTLVAGVNGDVVIPECVTSIGEEAFVCYGGLKSMTIPPSVTNIGSYAFFNCEGITSVTIPSSVMTIGESAFSECYGLVSATISEGVISIGDRAFDGCRRLNFVSIPTSVTNIGNAAFWNCPNLKSVDVVKDGKVESIPIVEFFRQRRLASQQSHLRERPSASANGRRNQLWHGKGSLRERRALRDKQREDAAKAAEAAKRQDADAAKKAEVGR